MKDRWLTLALALASFVAFYQFFIGPARSPDDESSRPLSTETRSNGYFAVRHWLETQGVPVVELRHRYDWLGRAPELPPRGNVLVATIPFKRGARPSELEALRDWVRGGNSLIVAAGLFDTPEWAYRQFNALGELHQLTGIRIQVADAEEAEDADEADEADEANEVEDEAAPGVNPFQRLDEPRTGALVPRGDHPLTRGISRVLAVSEYPAGQFVALTPPNTSMLALMSDEESGEGALWLTWDGDGAILVSGYGSVFTNKMLGQAHNAGLMANAVAQLVGPGGRVVFDDMHQGAASLYDAEAFFGDPRLHASFWWVMALWLLWVMGSTRLPPPAGPPAPVRERAFLAATGQFFARVVDRRLLAKRLFANFFNEYRRGFGQPADGEPLWQWMRSFGSIPQSELDRIEELHARVAAGRRVDILDLHNRLQQLRKQLT